MRWLRSIFLLGLVLAVLAAGSVAWLAYRYQNAALVFSTSPARVTLARGAGPKALSSQLRGIGVDVAPWQLRLIGRWRGDLGRMKAGIYQFDSPLPLRALLDKMVAGDVYLEEIRFIEGWNFKQIRAAVDANEDLRHDTRGLPVEQLMQRIGATEAQPEGLFFPSTYTFSPGSSDVEIYRAAYRQMQQRLQDAWNARRPGLPYQDPYQMLILASIIEKETGAEADRTKVAAVFVNRLRKGMMLQSDPTTIYGLGEQFDGNLRRRHLTADTPFNTYTRSGLPPTPIAAPGVAALTAAGAPADIPALYFVARGDGSSEFSNDLDAHNRAVGRYQLKQK